MYILGFRKADKVMAAYTKLMGLDYGERRIGVALSDNNKIIASGYTTIDCRKDLSPLDTIGRIISQENVEALVVGYPQRTDGLPGGKAEDVEIWIQKLQKKFKLPVFREDESYTTQRAVDSLRSRKKKIKGKHRKGQIDRVAACFILQEFLDRRGKQS
jgi:putative Holliday junction resolvase